jgi:uncharacterized protein DUF1801
MASDRDKRLLREPSAEVAEVFSRFGIAEERQLRRLRKLIFEVAARTPGVGEITETLRWDQPAYLTESSKSGSLVRIDAIKSRPGKIGVFFHCQTSLVGTFRELYRDRFEFDGNRCLVLDANRSLPRLELEHCIELALTYRLKTSVSRKR